MWRNMYLLPGDESIGGHWRKVADTYRSAQTSKSACLLEIGATVVSEDAQVEDSHSDRCQLCGLQFSTFTRRHHCKSSGLLVCWYCTTKSFPLLLNSQQQEGRVSDGQWNKLNWLAANWSEEKSRKRKEEEEASSKTERADSWVDAADEMRKLGGVDSVKQGENKTDEKKKNLGGTNSTDESLEQGQRTYVVFEREARTQSYLDFKLHHRLHYSINN